MNHIALVSVTMRSFDQHVDRGWLEALPKAIFSPSKLQIFGLGCPMIAELRPRL